MQLPSTPLYIAGVGASAGGLEALKTMLDHTPSDTGISFVIVQHLSPNHKSFMTELLSRHTEMEIIEIHDHMKVESNKVYILPPKHALTIQGHRLRLTELHEPHKIKTIDMFFQSLAEEEGSRAIGIILSGTGSDGAKGIECIKENCGMTIVQHESNAKFDGMPKSAIQTGLTDYILPVERIGAELTNIVKAGHQEFHLEESHKHMVDLNSKVSAILALIKEHLQIDFAQYKNSSVLRRIEKRMAVNRIYNINKYIEFLKLHPDEIVKLKRDLLIGVTSFFRDAQAFEDLAHQVIPAIFENKKKEKEIINLDLIVCRNLLIYFQTVSQRKVLSLFHFALNENGYLFLGSSETVGKSSPLFEPFVRKSNIYKYKESNKFVASNMIRFEEHMINKLNASRKYSALSDFSGAESDVMEIETTILKEYIPATIIIDDHNRMVYSNGPVNRIIRMPQGEPTNNILKLVPEELTVAVRAAIHKVRRAQVEVFYYDLKLNVDGHPQHLYMKAKPFILNGQSDYIILFFDDVGLRAPSYQAPDQYHANSDLMKRIDELEVELQHTKEYLQMTKEELETSNEELQSTNEELIAANEELQSSNEELQSLNEELLTVNNDYQEKIEQLTELTDDINNLLISTNIGTIFLDKNLCIRRFTPSITKEVHLIEVDIGRPLNHFSHKFKYDSLIADAQSVLEHAHTIEKKIETVDGQWYSMKVLPYYSKKNTLDGVVITFNDITDLKNLNEHLQLLSYAIEQSPISIAIFNVTGDIQYVNPQFMKQTGFSFDECVGKHLTELYPADFNEKFADIWDKVRSGETWAGEWKNTRKNGELYWENVSILPITDEKNQIIYFLKVAEDVTERKKTENLLLESEMHSAVGQLAAGIAHEIRNPLTALKGFTQLMLTGSLNQEYIRIMQAELDRINLIVNELLFLSRPRAVEFEDKNIIAIVREVVGLLESQALMNNCEIVLELEVKKYTVRCVEHQMKQVFINLIKNAIEAMPKGGQITVTAQLLEDFISIQIRDEGCGIPDKMLSKIGQPFFTTKEKGTGLGLMVCQKIIQNHDGKLTIASKENEGTTLHIVLSR